MLNLPARKPRAHLPTCVRDAALAIFDLDACIEVFPMDELQVAREVNHYFSWKYKYDRVFDPLYAGVGQLSYAAGHSALREAQKIVGYWEARAVPWATPRESALNLIRTLRAQGTIVAVTSERMQYTAKKLLTRFQVSGRVDMVVGGDDVRWPRPDPEPLNMILSATGFRPHEAIYIGSRRSDYELGERAGIPTYVYNFVLDSRASRSSQRASLNGKAFALAG